MRTSTPGKSASQKRNNKGLTLIEVLVGMAIIGLIVGLSAVGLRSAFNVNLKASAGKLASTLRFLSQKAVTDHVYLRAVYDLEERRYSIEESSESFVVSDQQDPKKTDKKEDQKEGEETPTDAASTSLMESATIKPVTLPSGIFFKGVLTSYRKDAIEQGKAYTYFFPDGYVTPTVIRLRNEDDDDHYSVEAFPLSGKVKIFSEDRTSFEYQSEEAP